MKRRLAIGLLGMGLSGCPDEAQNPDRTAPEAVSTNIPALPSSTATPSHPQPPTEEVTSPCGVDWIGIETCAADTTVYAVAEAPAGRMGPNLATAKVRSKLARLIGADKEEVTLQGVELIDSMSCEGLSYVLARMPRAQLELPDCSVMRVLARAPAPETCPDWVRGILFMDGDATVSVGVARGVRNLDLARKTAANRARAQVGQLDSVTVKLSANGSSSSSVQAKTIEGGTLEYAECDDAVFAKLTLGP